MLTTAAMEGTFGSSSLPTSAVAAVDATVLVRGRGDSAGNILGRADSSVFLPSRELSTLCRDRGRGRER